MGVVGGAAEHRRLSKGLAFWPRPLRTTLLSRRGSVKEWCRQCQRDCGDRHCQLTVLKRCGEKCGLKYAPPGPAAFAALGQRSAQQVPEASRSEAGRAAADVYSKAKDGGTLSRYLPLCESYRRRVRSCAVRLRTSLPKQRRNLGFLGGRRIRTVPPTGG